MTLAPILSAKKEVKGDMCNLSHSNEMMFYAMIVILQTVVRYKPLIPPDLLKFEIPNVSFVRRYPS